MRIASAQAKEPQAQQGASDRQQQASAQRQEAQSTRSSDHTENREDWQDHQNQQQEDRQNYGREMQEDRQDFYDDEVHHWGYGTGGAFLAGGAVAPTIVGSSGWLDSGLRSVHDSGGGGPSRVTGHSRKRVTSSHHRGHQRRYRLGTSTTPAAELSLPLSSVAV